MQNPYVEKEYLWPPRPENAITRDMLGFYENRGWYAQVKKNGSCTVLWVHPNKQVTAMNRHAEEHADWAPSAATSAPFKKLPGKGFYVFVGELLHNKVKGMRDTLYLFDILVHRGHELVGETFAARQMLMRQLFPIDHETTSHSVITDNVWLARNHISRFRDLFESLDSPEDEGLVLKNPTATLKPCWKPSSNSGWQCKVRVTHKNYGF